MAKRRKDGKIDSHTYKNKADNSAIGAELTNHRSKLTFEVKGNQDKKCRKEIVSLSIIVSELWPFEIFNLASEVKFKDLKYPLLKSYKRYYTFFFLAKF